MLQHLRKGNAKVFVCCLVCYVFLLLGILQVKQVMDLKANLTPHLATLLEDTAEQVVLVQVVVCQMAHLPVAKTLLNRNFLWVCTISTNKNK